MYQLLLDLQINIASNVLQVFLNLKFLFEFWRKVKAFSHFFSLWFWVELSLLASLQSTILLNHLWNLSWPIFQLKIHFWGSIQNTCAVVLKMLFIYVAIFLALQTYFLPISFLKNITSFINVEVFCSDILQQRVPSYECYTSQLKRSRLSKFQKQFGWLLVIGMRWANGSGVPEKTKLEFQHTGPPDLSGATK